MGKIIVLHDVSFASHNLGKITLINQGEQGNQNNVIEIITKYDIDLINESTLLYRSIDDYDLTLGPFSSIEIDGVLQPQLINRYTFSTAGEHTIKYTLTDSTSLGSQTFYDLEYLSYIEIPNTITSIGDHMFYHCYLNQGIIIPNSVTSIGEDAFCGSSLTNIEIPNSVTSIGDGAFCNCFYLNSIICNALVAPSISNYTFSGIKSNGTLIIPDNATGYDVWLSNEQDYLGYYGWTLDGQGESGNQGGQTSQYNLWDILYTDGNGNLSVSSEVLDVSLGKTPIAICIAKTGFFGENEKARWMALKYLDRNIGPNNGSITYNDKAIYFGPNINIPEISDVTKAYVGATGTNQDWGVFEYGNTYNNPVLVPNVYDSNGDWNLSELGTIGDYAVTDIDGKSKTTIYLSYVTVENWQTSSIGDNTNTGNWPAVMAAWHYAPSGTQQGDWYIGACGEYALMCNLRSTFATKIGLIHASYPNDCYEAPTIDNSANNGFEIWTTTERDNGQQYRINTRKGQFGSKAKNVKTNGSKYCIPLLQY